MAVVVDDATLDKLRDVLVDPNIALSRRYRALFTLKNIGGDKVVAVMGQAFEDPSALLKHEVAYCLGQLQNPVAVPILEAVIRNTAQEAMVRHEAGEALGAIGGEACIAILKEFCADPAPEVSETCQLAVDLLEWRKTEEKVEDNNPYHSVDPAPPMAGKSVEELAERLRDTSLPLFKRYRAMFALRNLNSEAAVLAICSAFDDESALFRHELAYVLGQMAHEASVPALRERLENDAEHGMVRHEAAEALGAIATEECDAILKNFKLDKEAVVADSCVVALDMVEHEQSGAFQYADGLSQVAGA